MVSRALPWYLQLYGVVLIGWSSGKTYALVVAAVMLGTAGLVLLARRVPELLAGIVATIGVLLVWPYIQDRFLTPIIPIVGLAVAYAAQRALVLLPRAARGTVLAVAALVGLVVLQSNLRSRHDAVTHGTTSKFALESAEIAEWIRSNTRPDERILANEGAALFLRTGRRTATPDPEEPALSITPVERPLGFFAKRLLADPADLFVLWDFMPGASRDWMIRLSQQCPGLLVRVPADSTAGSSSAIHYFHLHTDLPCLTQIAGGLPPIVPRQPDVTPP
ncbi:MAG TPA: hypothetical protein VHE78_07780 [Gemmatimonadaceae bacterium]|nr:hypothetical protein [Gemmatimonadaceae bacterium]